MGVVLIILVSTLSFYLEIDNIFLFVHFSGIVHYLIIIISFYFILF